jgi:Protein of unknown function (DUF1674)
VTDRRPATEGAAPVAGGRGSRPEDDRGTGRPVAGPAQMPGEVDGPKGPEPTRFGDWEKGGRCTDF